MKGPMVQWLANRSDNLTGLMLVVKRAAKIILASLCALLLITPQTFARTVEPRTITIECANYSVQSPLVSIDKQLFVPLYYVHLILQSNGIHDVWDARRHNWLIRANNPFPDLFFVPVLLVPTSEPPHGQVRVYVDGGLTLAHVRSAVATDPLSKNLTTYLPFEDLRLLLNYLGFQQSPAPVATTWQLKYRKITLPIRTEPSVIPIHAGDNYGFPPTEVDTAERLSPILPVNPTDEVTKLTHLSLTQILLRGTEGTAAGDSHSPLTFYSINYVYGHYDSLTPAQADHYVIIGEGKAPSPRVNQKPHYDTGYKYWTYDFNVFKVSGTIEVWVASNISEGLVLSLSSSLTKEFTS